MKKFVTRAIIIALIGSTDVILWSDGKVHNNPIEFL